MRWVFQNWLSKVEGSQGWRHETIFAALGVADVEHHPRAIDVGDLKMSSLLKPQPAAIDRGKADPVARVPDQVDPACTFQQLRDWIREERGIATNKTAAGTPGSLALSCLVLKTPSLRGLCSV